MSARFRLYRFHHADGTSKDWAILATDEGVVVRYGKTGHLGRIHEIPRDAKTFRAATPEAEGERRIGEQLRQGYVYLGEATFNSRGVAHIQSKASARQCLHWTVETPPRTDVHIWAAAVLTRAQEIGHVLCQHGYLTQCACDRDVVALQGHDGTLAFEFGFCEEPRSGRISRRTRRGSGSAPAQRIAEVLFLLALAKSFPEFALADDAGNVIEPKLDGNPLLADGTTHYLRVAEELGLSPPRIRWDAIGTATPTLFY